VRCGRQQDQEISVINGRERKTRRVSGRAEDLLERERLRELIGKTEEFLVGKENYWGKPRTQIVGETQQNEQKTNGKTMSGRREYSRSHRRDKREVEPGPKKKKVGGQGNS